MTSLLLGHGSYLAIVLVLVLTGAGLPIPEEVPVIAAGVMASNGHLDPWLALACCMLGAIGGDCLLYAIGRYFGDNLAREHPYWRRFVKPEREARVKRMLGRHGLKVFFLTRFLIGLRSSVYLTAGLLRMPFRRFLLTDLSCAVIVIGTVYLLAFRFGQAITFWIKRAEILVTAAVGLLLAVALVWLIRHFCARRSPMPSDPSGKLPLVHAQSEKSPAANSRLAG